MSPLFTGHSAHSLPPPSRNCSARRAHRPLVTRHLSLRPQGSCPGLSKLSPPIRPPNVPVREAVFLVFNVDIPPVSQPSESAKRHPRHSSRQPSPLSTFQLFNLSTLQPSVFLSAKRFSPRSCRGPSALLPRPSRSPSAWARQDAAPPEAEQHLMKKRCGTSGGAASR